MRLLALDACSEYTSFVWAAHIKHRPLRSALAKHNVQRVFTAPYCFSPSIGITWSRYDNTVATCPCNALFSSSRAFDFSRSCFSASVVASVSASELLAQSYFSGCAAACAVACLRVGQL